MAALITTYGGLTTAVAEWLGRAGDTDVTGRIDDIIALHEQRMYYGAKEVPGLLPQFEPIRIREMETVDATFALSDGVAQPVGFLDLIEVTLNSPKRPLDIVTEAVLDSYGEQTLSGVALIAISGTNFRVKEDTSGATATLRYFQKLDTPSATNPANWILTNAPGVYLQGCLMQAAILTGDADAARMYGLLYVAEVGALNERRNRELAMAHNVRMRIRGRTP